MASVIKLGKSKQPPRAIDFTDSTESPPKRKRIRLGVVSHGDAREAKHRIEKLLGAKVLNATVDTETCLWLTGISDSLHERIARSGLCESREAAALSPSLGDWLSKYLSIRKSDPSFKPGSYQRLRQTADRLLAAFGEALPIDKLTPNSTKDWRADMTAEGLAEATVRLHCRNAKTIFADAVDRELIKRSPFAKLKSSSISADNDRIVDPAETLALLEAAPNVQWRLLIGLARLAGLRIPSESHILRWGDVDWDRRRLTVYAPKTDTTRFTPIVPELYSILSEAHEAAPEGSEHIVTLSRNNLHRDFRLIVLRAGVEPWDDLWQTLRRSAETMFAERYPQKDVSAWIGHSVKVSLKHYAKATETQYEAAASTPVLRAAKSAAVLPGTGQFGVANGQGDNNGEDTSAQKQTRTSHEVTTQWSMLEMGRAGIEPATPGFSVLCSTN